MLEQQRVRTQFSRSARSYDAVAVVQRTAGERLLERLDYLRLIPTRVLDVGCGTGELTRVLQRRYPRAEVWGVDIALPMLEHARRKQRFWQRAPRWVCGLGESLPCADASVDLLVSNLMLQWCPDLLGVLAEWRRVLRPGGALLLTTFGPMTLKELRASWAAVDTAPHVHDFYDINMLGDALLRVGLGGVVADSETLTLTYQDASAVMRDLQQLGAGNALATRRRGLLGKGRLAGMLAAYEQFRRSEDGRLPASFEVLYGHAWRESTPMARAEGGEVRISPQQITRRSG
jgi:malonyl-CoA O-methyltransferase